MLIEPIVPASTGGAWQNAWHGIADEFSDLPGADPFARLVLRLTLAALVGGVLGWERERSGKDAGLRTHMLVALAAALFVLVPEQESMATADLSRVVQGVVAGVGFLGAGAILKNERGRVQGLTSAANIWITASLGVAAGLGRAATAVVGTAFALAILVFVRKAEAYRRRRAAKLAPPP